jgi:hypothetical protein
MTMAMELEVTNEKLKNVAVYGSRSGFRDWPEMLLLPARSREQRARPCHRLAEQACSCSDAIEKRRRLIEAWAT